MRDCRKHQAVWMVVVLLKKKKKMLCALPSPLLHWPVSSHTTTVQWYLIQYGYASLKLLSEKGVGNSAPPGRNLF